MLPVSRSLCAFGTLVALGTAATAQIKPGESIATATGPSNSSALWRIDHQTNTATQLKISAALASAGMNTVMMLAGGFGFVGTVTIPGDIYQITITGSTVTEKKLNTTATAGGNVAQITRVGGILYFSTQGGTAGGVLQSMSIGGGPVTKVLDLGSVGAAALANAATVIGTKVYVATFDSGTSSKTGELVVYDTATKKGALVMKLPKGKRQISATLFSNTGIVAMHPDPSGGGRLVLWGVYGDLLVIDPAAKKVVRHDFTGPRLSATRTSFNLVNSFAWDADRSDWVVGSRDGHVERIVGGSVAEGTNGHSAEKIIRLATAGSVNGVWHFAQPTAGKDRHIGTGCPGKGGFTLTDVSLGLPSLGNASFAIGLHSGTGGAPYTLLIGKRQTPPLKLDPFGLTPNCFLRVAPVTDLAGTLTGAGNGNGKAVIKLPIPKDPSAKGAKITRQSAELQLTGKTNPFGIVVSNGREMELR